MKKTLISLALGLLMAGNAMAETAVNSEAVEVFPATEIKIPSVKVVTPKAEGLSITDFGLKIAATKNFDNYGGVEVIRDLTPFGLEGLYEIKLGGKDTGVMTSDMKYVFLGDVISFQNGAHKNISADYRSDLMQKVAKNEVEHLSEDAFITYAPTAEKIGTLYVYTDTTCGYCRKLHTEIDQLTSGGVEVKYIAYPRSSVEEQVAISRDEKGGLVYGENKTLAEMGAIYCQKDRQAALTFVKNGGSSAGYMAEYEPNKQACNALVKEGYESGQRIGFGGTPFLYLDNGTVVPGYQPASSIIEMFKASK